MLVKMKGGRTRTMLLRSLLEPKNKLQLSHELGIDWKAVDGHMTKLLEYTCKEGRGCRHLQGLCHHAEGHAGAGTGGRWAGTTVSIVPKGIQRTAEMMDHVKDERGMLS